MSTIPSLPRTILAPTQPCTVSHRLWEDAERRDLIRGLGIRVGGIPSFYFDLTKRNLFHWTKLYMSAIRCSMENCQHGWLFILFRLCKKDVTHACDPVCMHTLVVGSNGTLHRPYHHIVHTVWSMVPNKDKHQQWFLDPSFASSENRMDCITSHSVRVVRWGSDGTSPEWTMNGTAAFR